MLSEGQEILEGRFQVIKRLGSGAFGEIYKGKDFNKLILSYYSLEEKNRRILCCKNCTIIISIRYLL